MEGILLVATGIGLLVLIGLILLIDMVIKRVSRWIWPNDNTPRN